MNAQITVHEEEIKDVVSLRKKLKENGFLLNDNFEKYLVPIKGTYINSSGHADSNGLITIIQKDY